MKKIEVKTFNQAKMLSLMKFFYIKEFDPKAENIKGKLPILNSIRNHCGFCEYYGLLCSICSLSFMSGIHRITCMDDEHPFRIWVNNRTKENAQKVYDMIKKTRDPELKKKSMLEEMDKALKADFKEKEERIHDEYIQALGRRRRGRGVFDIICDSKFIQSYRSQGWVPGARFIQPNGMIMKVHELVISPIYDNDRPFVKKKVCVIPLTNPVDVIGSIPIDKCELVRHTVEREDGNLYITDKGVYDSEVGRIFTF